LLQSHVEKLIVLVNQGNSPKGVEIAISIHQNTTTLENLGNSPKGVEILAMKLAILHMDQNHMETPQRE